MSGPGRPDSEADPAAGLSFEEAMRRLEETAERLESDDIGLEEALGQYRLGTAYYRQCDRILRTAQQTIETYRKEEEDE